MHIVLVVTFGLVALGAFVLIASWLKQSGSSFDGAYLFIWVWLAASLANAAVGVIYADIPIVNEIAAFVPIFGIPAGAAWYLSRRTRSG
jgi:hypothetical protein